MKRASAVVDGVDALGQVLANHGALLATHSRQIGDGALPSRLARWHVEQDDQGRLRVGVRNVATGDVRWLTGYFGTPPVDGDPDLAGAPLDEEVAAAVTVGTTADTVAAGNRGLPAGGTAGDVLVKVAAVGGADVDYAADWMDVQGAVNAAAATLTTSVQAGAAGLADTQHNVSTLTAQLAAAVAQLATAQNTIALLQSQVTTLLATASTHTSQIASLTADVGTLGATLTTLRTAYNAHTTHPPNNG